MLLHIIFSALVSVSKFSGPYKGEPLRFLLIFQVVLQSPYFFCRGDSLK